VPPRVESTGSVPPMDILVLGGTVFVGDRDAGGATFSNS
jgi:hypothetical protein